MMAPIARALDATHAMTPRMVVEDGKSTVEVALIMLRRRQVAGDP